MSEKAGTDEQTVQMRMIALIAATVLLLAALSLWAVFGGAVFAKIGAGVWALCF
jgi:hypothetical protein